MTRLALGLLLTAAANAQWTQQLGQRGFVPGAPFDVSGFDSVNMVNGAVNLTLPLTALPAGRGGDPGVGITLHYNSAAWDGRTEFAGWRQLMGGEPDQSDTYYAQQHVTFAGSWSYGFNYGIVEEVALDPTSNYYTGHCWDPNWLLISQGALRPFRQRAVFPDGSLHVLFLGTDPGGTWGGSLFYQTIGDGWSAYDFGGVISPCGQVHPTLPEQIPGTIVYYTRDGTRLRVELNTATGLWTMYFPDGKKVQGQGDTTKKIWDRNDNEIGFNPMPDETCPEAALGTCTVLEITDEFNRKIRKLHAISGTYGVDWIQQVGFGGNLQWKIIWASAGWVSRGYPVDFGPLEPFGTAITWPCDPYPPGNFCSRDLQTFGITSVQLEPAAGSHEAITYSFEYTATSPNGLVSQVTLPYGALINYEYKDFQGIAASMNALPLARKTLTFDDGEHGTHVEEWVYDIPYPHENRPWATVTNPDDGVVTHRFRTLNLTLNQFRGRAVRIDQPDGSRIENIWADQGFDLNPYIKTEIRSVAASGAPTKAAVKEMVYDLNGNVRQVTEYPWLTYNATNLPHDADGAVTVVNNLGAAVRTTTNRYYVCVLLPCVTGSPNTADEYWKSSAPRVLNALATTKVEGGGVFPAMSYAAFQYNDGADGARANGNVTKELRWDSQKVGSQPTGTDFANGAITERQFVSNGKGLVAWEKDPRGYTLGYTSRSYTYGSLPSHPYPSQLVEGQAGETLTWGFGWHASTGLRTSETNPNSAQTTASYDRRGRTTLLTEANNRQTKTTYSDSGRSVTTEADLTNPTDAAIKSIQYLSTAGQQYRTQRTDDDGTLGIEDRTFRLPRKEEDVTYQVLSNPRRTVGDSTMGWTRTTLDQNGRVKEIEYFSGAEEPWPWGNNSNSTGKRILTYAGEFTDIRDEAGKWTRQEVDALGRLVRVIEAPGLENYITNYEYDTLDNLRRVCQNAAACPGGQMRTFTYSSLNRLISATNPENGTISYTYDDNGNVLTRTDARNVVTTMTYNSRNQVTTKSYSDGVTPAVTYCYDGQTWTGTFGQCTGTRSSPFLGRLTEVVSTASSTRYTNYDSLGRITGSRQTTSGVEYNFSYLYNLAGGMTRNTYPSGRQVDYGFSNAGRVSTVTGLKSGVTTNYTKAATAITYAPHGGVATMTYGNNLTETRVYNSRLQPTSIAAGSLLTLGFTYGTTNNNGNVATQTITRPSVSSSLSYGYDNFNRLTSATQTGTTPYSHTYGYDAYGNRWQSAPSPTTVETPTAQGSYLSTNRINGWAYDSAGNITGIPAAGGSTVRASCASSVLAGQQALRTSCYDGENHQTSATNVNGVTAIYTYDGEGKRIKSTVSGVTTTFVYDASGSLAAEYGGTTPTETGIRYFSQDHLGSTRLVTKSDGTEDKRYDYFPFGQEIFTGGVPLAYPQVAGNNTVKFTSKERDTETGLDFFLARYYAPAQGRFTSPDEWAGGIVDAYSGGQVGKPGSLPYADISDPQTINKYAYVRNNPLRFTDPDGHILDTLADAAFILYDLYTIAKEGATKTNITALGADAAGLFIPFATGGGAVVRSARAIDKGVDTLKASGKADDLRRLPQDINVNPQAPSPLPTNRPIGTSSTQNAAAQGEVRRMEAQGFVDIRVNQQQVNGAGQRVGTNRPDVSGTNPSTGNRVNVEFDRSTSTRGVEHERRIRANDPQAEVILRKVD